MIEFRYAGGFRPGDAVAVVDGTFVGMSGKVVSPGEVAAMRETTGEAPSAFLSPREQVWVVVEIFGRPVAVQLEPFQIRWSN